MCGEMRNAYKILFRNPKGKRPLRRPRHIWESNIIKVDLRETECEGADWIYLTQDRVRDKLL
jgi:hypothetical protein